MSVEPEASFQRDAELEYARERDEERRFDRAREDERNDTDWRVDRAFGTLRRHVHACAPCHKALDALEALALKQQAEMGWEESKRRERQLRAERDEWRAAYDTALARERQLREAVRDALVSFPDTEWAKAYRALAGTGETAGG